MKINKSQFGLLTFNIGIFLLFSAPWIASFFLLISIFISFFNDFKNPFKDNINKILFLISLLMIISLISFKVSNQYFDLNDFNSIKNTNPYLSLLNWIPLFFFFSSFQSYLKTDKNRKYFIYSLTFGSIPILISGFGQVLFNWYGPLEFLNGIIIWYQRSNTTGMTGIFNNQNTAGCALATVWPFFLAFLLTKNKYDYKNFILILLNIIIIFGIIFTTSRNALLGFIIGSFLLLIKSKSKRIINAALGFISVFIINALTDILFEISFIPDSLISKLNFKNFISDARYFLWKDSIKYVLERPFLGWGGHSFSTIWNAQNIRYFGHSHSLPLELAIQYGLITAIALTCLIGFILFKSFKVIFLRFKNQLNFSEINNYFDKAWFSASLIIIFSNLIDILYFDIRISLLTWLLLAGLINIVREKELFN